MSSKNRKVYEMGDRSIREFFSSPTRYLAQAISRESEFEKPYLDDDRGRMHNDPSWPDWPPLPELPPPPGIEGPIPGLPGCGILCYPPHMDCDNPVWCHPVAWCGEDIGCTLCTWEVEGSTSGYEPHFSGVGGWGIDIWIDKDILVEGKALITACMTDPCGNVCCDEIEVDCCPAAVSLSWDSVTSVDTLTAGNDGVIAIEGGMAPYTWELQASTGTGWSLGAVGTTGLANTIAIAAAGSCGSAHIKVTDACDETVTATVRCTDCGDSDWVLSQNDVCVLPGSGSCSYSYPLNTCELIEGAGKQIQYTRSLGGGCCWWTEAEALATCVAVGAHCDVHANCHADENIACVNCIDSVYPIGYHPGGCLTYYDGSTSTWGYTNWCVGTGGYDYYLWECV